MNKLAIVGLGVVGKAYKWLYPDAVGYDLDCGTKEEVNMCKVAFLCVPTPTNNGVHDISALEEVLSWIKCDIIVIKSTVLPGTTKKLIDKYKKKIIFSPEFLRGATANEDVQTEPIYLCGRLDIVNELIDILYQGDEDSIRWIEDTTAGELVKYGRNCFLAMKVSFFNQMYDVCEQLKVNYEPVRLGIVEDKRIRDSHSKVTEARGYDGHCFVKDVDAFQAFFPQVSILAEVHKYNKGIRNGSKL